jgi:hypothetical protein
MKLLLENPAIIVVAWLCVAVILFLIYHKYMNKKVQMCSNAAERSRLKNNYLVLLFTGATLWLIVLVLITQIFAPMKPWWLMPLGAMMLLPLYLKDYKRKPKRV